MTGGAGAIGSNLVRRLLTYEVNRVVVLDDLSSGRLKNLPAEGRLTFVQGSVTKEEDLDRAFSFEPHIVFHLAALFANQNSVDHPEKDLHVNGLGTLKVLERCRRATVEAVVFASSGCAMVKEGQPLPVKEEEARPSAATPYQITKFLGEMYCQYFFELYGLPVVRVRLFNSYGPGEFPGPYRNVIPNFLYRALWGLPLVITGTGEETRDFTYVDDIVEGLLRAAACKEARGEAINIASGVETKIRRVAEVVLEKTGSRVPIVFGKRRVWDRKERLLADISKARALLGYKPGGIGIEEGIERTLKWMMEHMEEIKAEVGPPNW